MLKNKMVFGLNMLLIAIALAACSPKKQQEIGADSEQASAAAAADGGLSLQGGSEKLNLNIPECEGKSCPEFSVERLHSNQFVLDELIDHAILERLEQMLAPVQHDSIASAQAKPDQRKQAAASTAAVQQSVSEAAANTAVQTPAQQFTVQVQPYLAHFLAVDKELKSLGANQKISLSIHPRILNSTPPLATIVINSSSYLGGAHGASAQRYYNFDLNTQQKVQLKDILLPNQYAQLNKLAYAAFKTWVMDSKLANNVAEYEQAWAFKLSNNFYLARQGLILQYDEYEIGPFAAGLPRLEIPYDQLQGIIKPQYLPAVQATALASSQVPALPRKATN